MRRGYLAVTFAATLGALGLASNAGAVDIDLRTNPGFVVYGAEGFDNTGRAVAMADLDGDGFRDIIIGSIGVDGAGNTVPGAGAVDIIWGDTRANLGPSKDLLTQSDVHIDGADTGDQVGIFVAAGDFDDDGLDDVAMGAALGDGPGNIRADCGDVYIFYGRARAAWAAITAVSQRDVVIYGADAGDNSGISIASGDVDGNGVADLLIGGSGMDGPGNARFGCGGVHVWYGGPRPEGGAVDLGSIALIDGADGGDLAGRSLASGDLDGDGADEIIIGVPNGSGPGNTRAQGGEVAILWGRSRDAMGATKDLLTDTDVHIYGAENGDNAGTAVDAADYDGDSFFDVFVGVPLGDALLNAKINAGETFLYYGRSRGSFPAAIDLSLGLAADGKRYIGQDAGDLVGSALTGGDLDGDGNHEINMGAPLADGNAPLRLSSGEVFMYFGGLRGAIADEVQIQATADVRVLGADAGDRVGSILDMGDLDNDGGLELAMGAPGGDSQGNTRSDGGEVHIIYGFGQVVPAILADFEATESTSGGGVELAWSTGEQSGILGFNLYRVLPGPSFERVNSTIIPISSGTAGSYRYVDTDVHAGVTGYEIRQVDFRGGESFLGLVGYTAPAGGVAEFALRRLTSPFVGSTSFAIAMPSRLEGRGYTVSLYNNAGRRVQSVAAGTVRAGTLEVRMDGTSLASGVYHLVVDAGGETLRSKVVKL